MIRSKPLLIAVVLVVIAAFAAKRLLAPRPTTSAPPTPLSHPTSGPLPGSALADSLKNGRPTLVDFGAGWCAPCREQAPILDEVAKLYREEANIVYVDTEAYSSIADSYGIRAIPTQIFFDANGKEVSRHLGLYPLEAIRKDLDKLGAR